MNKQMKYNLLKKLSRHYKGQPEYKQVMSYLFTVHPMELIDMVSFLKLS